jgi:3-hydroxyanthranilate 3,4-dioxygenase
MLSTFKEVGKRGSYDEYPVFPSDVDPQLHLSKNDCQQPFFLICEKDTVIAQFSGAGTVEFKGSSVNYFSLEPGDNVYVPAGTPHRFTPKDESIQYRYKANVPGLEGVAWYCGECENELDRVVWDTQSELEQEGYLRACNQFNGDKKLRTCSRCEAVHPEIDLSSFNWSDVAAELREET